MLKVGGSPVYHRATLIQAYSGFVGELEPHLSNVLLKNRIDKKQRLQFIKWILAEELWLCHLMADSTHQRSHGFAVLYQELNALLPFNISQCFTNYFFVPTVVERGYGITVDVEDVGFFIRYYTNEIQPMARAREK